MSSPLCQRIDRILSADDDPIEAIEALILETEWGPACECLMGVLEDAGHPPDHWETVAAVMWGAILDRRPVPADRLIALLYVRLPHDADSSESNLAWSVASELRGVGYLSGYDPLADPRVTAEMASIRR